MICWYKTWQNTPKHWLWFCFKTYQIAAPVVETPKARKWSHNTDTSELRLGIPQRIWHPDLPRCGGPRYPAPCTSGSTPRDIKEGLESSRLSATTHAPAIQHCPMDWIASGQQVLNRTCSMLCPDARLSIMIPLAMGTKPTWRQNEPNTSNFQPLPTSSSKLRRFSWLHFIILQPCCRGETEHIRTCFQPRVPSPICEHQSRANFSEFSAHELSQAAQTVLSSWKYVE